MTDDEQHGWCGRRSRRRKNSFYTPSLHIMLYKERDFKDVKSVLMTSESFALIIFLLNFLRRMTLQIVMMKVSIYEPL